MGRPRVVTVGNARNTPPRVIKRQADLKPRWLSAYREMGGIVHACEAVGVTRTTVYRWRSEDEDFKRKWDQADEQAIESLERIARRRAENGSDLLTIFLLKAHRPSVYRDNSRVELTGAEGGPVQYTETFDDHERALLRKAITGVTEGTPVGTSEPVS